MAIAWFVATILLSATLLVSLIAAIVVEAVATTHRYRHIPWVGGWQTWYGLLYSRFANVFKLKGDHAAIAKEVYPEWCYS